VNSKLVIVAAVGALICGGLQGCGGGESRRARALERGQQYLAAGNYSKARIEFSNALQIKPNDADARYYAAFAAEKAGDLRAAAQGYQSALNVDETHALSLAALGRVYLFSGLPQQGLDMAEKGLAAHPDHPELLVIRAAAKLALGREQEALDDASTVLAQNPDHEYAVALVAGIYRNRGDVAKAIEVVGGTLARLPASIDLRAVLAQLYVDAHDNEHAEEQLKKIVEVRPAELQHRQRLAAFYASTGKPDAAEATLRELTAIDPKSTEYKFALINFVASQKSFDAAEQELVGFLAKNPKDYPLRLAAGQFYEAHNLPAEAERTYKQVIAEAGSDNAGFGARDRLAALELRSNRVAEAEPLIAEVLAKNPRDNDGLMLRATLALAGNRPLDAITDLRAVLRDQPDSVPTLRTLARAHIQNNEPDLAREQYRHAIAVDTVNNELRNEYADFLIRIGDTDEATRMLDAVVHADPQNLVALELKYRAFTAANDAAGAAEVSKKIVASYPESPLGYFFQGALEESAGDLAAAKASYEHSLEKAPRGAEPLAALARVFARQGKTSEALKYLEDTIVRDPDNSVAMNLAAELYLGQRNFDRAIELGDRAIASSANWWIPYRTKAYALLAKGAKEDAVAAYVAGMSATGDAPALGMDLAALYEREQQPERAIEVYERMFANNPSSEAIANNLAMLLANYRNDDLSYQRAHDLIRAFRNSSNPAYLNTYGWVRYRQRQFDEAITYLRRAAIAVPDSGLMHYHLAMALIANGQSDQARAELQKALGAKQSFPGREAAERALQSLPPSPG
jgi:tetratricopeptide (TPR) repeat protein